MPTGGDTTAATDRGQKFAMYAASNPNSSVGEAWANTISLLAYSQGQACYGQSAPKSDGYGGKGFNGCGCNLIFATDITGPAAVWRITGETWTDLMNDANDTYGSGWYSDTYLCNYPQNQYPFSQ